jgi:hypothetical protein
MKNLMTLTLLLSSLAASAADYNCIAGRQETIKIKARMNASKVILAFSESNNTQVDRDLNGKIVEFKRDLSRPGRYQGKATVSERYRDYRYMEVYLPPTVKIGQSKLNGKFDLSSVTGLQSPLGFSVYDLNCVLIKDKKEGSQEFLSAKTTKVFRHSFIQQDNLSSQCRQTVVKAILKKYPSIKRKHGSIEESDIQTTQVPGVLEAGFSSQEECSGGVEVRVQQSAGGKCVVQEISKMDEQC